MYILYEGGEDEGYFHVQCEFGGIGLRYRAMYILYEGEGREDEGYFHVQCEFGGIGLRYRAMYILYKGGEDLGLYSIFNRSRAISSMRVTFLFKVKERVKIQSYEGG